MLSKKQVEKLVKLGFESISLTSCGINGKCYVGTIEKQYDFCKIHIVMSKSANNIQVKFKESDYIIFPQTKNTECDDTLSLNFSGISGLYNLDYDDIISVHDDVLFYDRVFNYLLNIKAKFTIGEYIKLVDNGIVIDLFDKMIITGDYTIVTRQGVTQRIQSSISFDKSNFCTNFQIILNI